MDGNAIFISSESIYFTSNFLQNISSWHILAYFLLFISFCISYIVVGWMLIFAWWAQFGIINSFQLLFLLGLYTKTVLLRCFLIFGSFLVHFVVFVFFRSILLLGEAQFLLLTVFVSMKWFRFIFFFSFGMFGTVQILKTILYLHIEIDLANINE